MKIKTIFILFFILLFTLTSINIIIVFILEEKEKRVEIFQKEMSDLNEIAEDLVISSQFQTRFARGYITRKDPLRLEWYNIIINILDGKTPRPDTYDIEYWDLVSGNVVKPPEGSNYRLENIEERLLKYNVTPAEVNKFNKAREQLFKLGRIEQIAIHAANGQFDDGTGSFARRGKTDQSFAIKLLYGDEYQKSNTELSFLISQFKHMVSSRYKQIIQSYQNNAHSFLKLNSCISLIIFVFNFCSILYMRQHFFVRASQLMRYVRSISVNRFEPLSTIIGNDEIGELANALNKMSENLNLTFDKLKEKINLLETALADLGDERVRSEKLLHNILPAAIATRLQGGEETIAEVYPEVTVSFADIVGFTDLSERLGPNGTVELLSTLFGAFDELAEKHKVEKIKTIGDCYMVVAGVPNRDPLHCQNIAEFALDALKVVEELSLNFPIPVKIRMGIHTGTVAAGVVGKKKFSYDLWGDVVNVASRFESTSAPGKIHVSDSVRIRLSDDFLFQEMGIIELKGKGSVTSFFLLGKKQNFISN